MEITSSLFDASASRSIARYRGSKTWSGITAPGKRTDSGSGKTGTSRRADSRSGGVSVVSVTPVV